jgi:UDP-GlcNAc:undecaprenyl-phosphate GlcNAc-1-phosphate transferase
MLWFKIPFEGVLALGSSILPLITALWVIALTQAINLIDGLDGLAAGIVAIASAALCVYGLRLEDLGLLLPTNIGPLLAAGTCGICLGFLPSNFHPARLFMGDAGALLLGLLMSAATMEIGGNSDPASGVTYFFFAPLLIPVIILGVPILDMSFAFIRRTASGQGFYNADKDHIHHRLVRLGHGHRRTVGILWLWTALLSGMVLFPLYDTSVNVFIPFAVPAMGVALYTWFHPGIRRNAADETAVPVASSSIGSSGGEMQ